MQETIPKFKVMNALTITPSSDNLRRKILKDQNKPSAKKEKPKNGLVLRKKDYEDLIQLKRKRDKTQKERSVLFFLVGLCLTLGALIILFNWNFVDNKNLDLLGANDDQAFEEFQDIPNTQQPPPPPPQVIQQPIIVEVPDEILLEEIDVDIDVEATEEMAIEDVIFDPVDEAEEEAEEIFQIVETYPAPVGGYSAFYTYIAENLKYPAFALQANIGGRVFVMFVVDKDGTITDVTALKGIGGGCDEEAVRVVQNAPKWIPGKQRGRKVKVRMTLPITFKLMRR